MKKIKRPYKNKTNKRASAQERGYDHEWQKLQRRFIRLNPNCVRCGQRADIVDHIRPVAQAPHLRLIISNLQSLCVGCHNVKTKRKDQGQRLGIMPDTNEQGWPTDPAHPWNKG